MMKSMGTVRRAYYAKKPLPNNPNQQINALVLDVEFFGKTHELFVPNTNFTLDNPALQVMAYCSVRPSTLESIDGVMVPLVTNLGMVTLHESVFANGRRFLEAAEWGPTAVSREEQSEDL